MIYLAADHRGFELKEKIKVWLKEWGHEYEDMGAFEFNKDDDYPDFIRKVAEAVANDPERSRGIILGGSGQGEAMVANRFKSVRAAVYYGPAARAQTDSSGTVLDMLSSTRMHNNANMLSLAGRFLTDEEIKNTVKVWLPAPFSGEERHARRIKQIDDVT